MCKSLKELLKEYEGKRVLALATQLGNYGDKLIILGSDKLLKELKFEQVINEQEVTDDDLIFVCGAGGLGATQVYASMAFELFKIQNRFPHNTIILGPTSTMLEPQLKLAINNPNLIMFARDVTTYEYLKGLKLNIKALHLDHCTSLNLEPGDINKNKIECVETLKSLFYRKDEVITIPNEINQNGFDLITDPCGAKGLSDWFNLHANSSEIVTNRLHSAVLGLILGKKVTLFHNYYHKNHSVWEYSLKDKGVNWIGKPWVFKDRLLTSKDLINFKDEL